MTTMVWGEAVQVILGIGIPVDVFTLDVSVLDGTDVLEGKLEADVTDYVQSISINRGRSDNLAQFQSGSCSLTLNNPNRIFDPINTASPYYDPEAETSGITPKRSIQILSEGEALFTGKIQDIDISYDLGGTSFVSIVGSDAFADLAAATIEQAFTPTVEKSGTRLETLLALPEVNLPNAQSIDVGTQDLGAYEVPVGTNALAYANQIAEAEFGYFFIKGDGTIRFTQRVSATFPEGIEAEFSDTGTDLPYSTLGITYGSEQLYNKVICSIPEGAAQIANNLDSQETFGIFSLDITDLILETNDQALELAVMLAEDYSTPVYRFDNISLKYNGLSEADQQILSRIELADFIQVTRNFPTGSPSQVTQVVRCEAIRHSITANQHQLDLRLSPALLVYPFILGGFPTVATRTNLIANPNFEVDLSTWSTSGTVARTTAQSYIGGASASLTYAGSGTVLIEQSTRSMVTAGLTYTASFYLKQSVDAGNIICNFMWYNAGGSVILDDTHQTNNPNTAWQRFSQTRTAPANAVSCSFRIYQTAGEGGGAIATVNYLDAVLLEEGSSLLPYFDGTYTNTWNGYGLQSKSWSGAIDASASVTTWTDGATRTNLISNPNFETDTSTWTVQGGATIARSTAQQYFGNASLLITSSATDYNGASMGTSRINIVAGQTYYLSAYVRNISGSTRNVYIGIQWYNSAGVYISEVNSGGQGTLATGGWARRFATGTAPANAVSANIFILSGTTGLTAGWQTAADGVLFEASSTLLPYFDGSFADAWSGYGLQTASWTGVANSSRSIASWYIGNSRTNLMPDPSCANASIATYWQANKITESLSTDYAYAGTTSLKGVIDDGTIPQYFQVLQTAGAMIDVIAGQTYTFSAYIYLPESNTADSTWRAELYFWNGSAYTGANAGSTITVTRGNWTRLTTTATVPAGYYKALPRILKTAPALAVGQIAYVDAWLLETGSTLLPYFDGSTADPYTGYKLISDQWNGTENASSSSAVWASNTAYISGSPLDSNYALS